MIRRRKNAPGAAARVDLLIIEKFIRQMLAGGIGES
jgi:hypothetical protein